jgi:hypothetical protein
MPKDNRNPTAINIPLVGKLIIELDEKLPSRRCKNLLFRIYNAVHGIDDIEEFCNGKAEAG